MVKVLELLDTNYSYIISSGSKALIIDPGESSPVLNYLKKSNLVPEGILITHNHFDHIDGVSNLKKEYPNIKIIDYKSVELSFKGFNIIKFLTPGHTLDSCCYYFPTEQIIFTGDTLFTGLCGKVMSGTLNQLFTSIKKLKQLPKNTKIYPGHEYLSNSINFMDSIDKPHIFYSKIQKKPFPSINTTIGSEIENNPFLTDDFSNFSYLRKLKG